MPDNSLFEEKISSVRTEVLFVALALLFFALLYWRLIATGLGIIAGILLLLSLFFSFYALNYRVLAIRISAENLHLRFGVFGWKVPLNSIEKVHADETSLWRIGGAGIHFIIMQRRYRAMFNFLAHRRVVLVLSTKKGLVQEIAFSTRHPEEVRRFISK